MITSKKMESVLISISSIILSLMLSLIIGSIIISILGYNPFIAYKSMIKVALFTPRGLGETLRQATPLILTALGFSIANFAGIFNIGMSGQAIGGWFTSVLIALTFSSMPKIVLLPLSLFSGLFVGMLVAFIPAFLKAFFKTNEIVVTIMMNYILLYLSTYILHDLLPKNYLLDFDSTRIISSNASLRSHWLTELFGGSRINLGIFISLIAVIFIWILIRKTTLGYDIQSVGLNPIASEYAGISNKRIIIFSMLISGGLAGLAGATEGLGTYENFFSQPYSLSMGFDGMTVCLLGFGNFFGIVWSAFLLSILKIGSLGMQIKSNLPFSIINLSTAIFIICVGVNFNAQIITKKLFSYIKRKNMSKKIQSFSEN